MCSLWLFIWKMKILGVINEGMDFEVRTLLEYWSSHFKSMDGALGSLKWLGGDTYKFENISCTLGMSFF